MAKLTARQKKILDLALDKLLFDTLIDLKTDEFLGPLLMDQMKVNQRNNLLKDIRKLQELLKK